MGGDTTTKLAEDMTRTGLNGAALVLVTMERRPDQEAVMDPPAPEPSKLKIEIATPLINMDMVLMDMEMDIVLDMDTVLEEETVMDLDPDMDTEEVVDKYSADFISLHMSYSIKNKPIRLIVAKK